MTNWLEQAGIVLLVEQYDACARFYGEIVGLEVYADLGDLTVFRFGSGYLAVERDGVAVPAGKSPARDPVTLRFNVADVDTEAARLRPKGIDNPEWYPTWRDMTPMRRVAQVEESPRSSTSSPPMRRAT